MPEGTLVRTYRNFWLVTASLMGAPCALLAFITLSLPLLVTVVAVSVSIVGVIGALDSGRSTRRHLSENWRRTILAGACLGLSEAGAVSEFGSFGTLVVVLVVLASPASLRWLSGRRLATQVFGGPTQPPGRGPFPTSAAPTSMTDAELNFAWRYTFVQLSGAGSTRERLVLTAIRSGLLDEIERRDPAGFDRWMLSGPRASSDPGRYSTSRFTAETDGTP